MDYLWYNIKEMFEMLILNTQDKVIYMKDEYVLFLDESEFKVSKTFTIGGIAVKKQDVPILEQGIEEIKKLIWNEEYIKANNPILHCTELQQVFRNRNKEVDDISGVKEEYHEFIKKTGEEIEKIYYQIYGKMSRILKKSNATVFSCIIKLEQLQDLFFIDENHNGVHLIDDKYNIALQKVIENYTHYLAVKDGYGDVVYESRNNFGENSAKSPDVTLINVYHKIQANNRGIVYTNSAAVQSRNRTIVTLSKSDNSAGLQLADFVAYNITVFQRCQVNQQITDFMKQIHKMSYNGGHSLEEKDQRFFWGMRVLPSYLQMGELLAANKSLKNANDNLKKERKRLKKTIDGNQMQIAQLEDKIKELEEENEELKCHIKSIDIDIKP